MRSQFDDYFYDSFIEVRKSEGKPYVQIVGESNEEMTIVHLDKNELSKLIEYLKEVHEAM